MTRDRRMKFSCDFLDIFQLILKSWNINFTLLYVWNFTKQNQIELSSHQS